MSATEEIQALAMEAPPPAEKPNKAEEEKPVREKKLRDLNEKKPKQTKTKPKTGAHPPYFQMIKEALLALNEKSGSSPYAIARYMEEKHKAVLPANFKKTLALQLKNSEARGKLVKVKASYKLSEAGKKEKSTTAKRTTRASSKAKEDDKKKTTTAKTKAKAAAPKAVVTKKKPAKKNKKSSAAKPKQPKSIKSPAAKKAKKA